jgi:NADH dehydrogenase
VAILLTGATGTVGAPVLRRLTTGSEPVRCLVRDPRRLGAQRVRVQIALGDLADPGSFRNALRGVDTVIHLAASTRDQQRSSIEELDAMAALRLVRAAERSGVRRFVFFSAIGASLHSPSRFLRAKALAREVVEASDLETTVFSPSIVYAPGEAWLALLARLSHLPAIPVPGRARGLFQPIWAEDVADCVVAALGSPGAERASIGPSTSFDLAGPETLSCEAIARLGLRPTGRSRRLVRLPRPLARASLRSLERIAGAAAFATWEEAQLLETTMTTPRGTADAEALGVTPLAMAAVLGAA